VLAFEDVSVAAGGRTLLSGLDFALRRGEVVGLVGRNGVGKTTLLRVATAVLPPSEADGLRAFVEEEWQAHLAEHEGATKVEFLRDCAHLVTHYALEWADREGRPAVAADDPDARGPGGQAMQRLVKWRQERVQIH